MVELEEEYATYRRTLAHGWEDVIKANQGFSSTLLKVIENHDRNISSKTFPRSILPPKPDFLKVG
ncbi:hypothetical protein SERLA73DRAFT_124837 [Serpula lacrymans var. lacrymans S7.3]|uniref:Uncharacterized protein n=2 Tax=Serpula lacrymans var. lacrymans TaxID=341189 RepID=F8Q5U5_SERL3|nr:uncharacterized protein SERLADRAFT_372156 [Serpula lacrymans var. lacrymans S7.9]EGN95983.1 hypothetical protein SERLA73DRAFT_124837 [Serpula lacrymans var. lacrymans S7.3]EGO21508.1 hypothetical protein SERLADRAFT_372156 [Serpula lacrymans var. lacrymans S7.9]